MNRAEALEQFGEAITDLICIDENEIKVAIDALRALYEAALDRMDVATGLLEQVTTPFPPIDCLRILADFAHRQLNECDYDGDGWEVVQFATSKAQAFLAGEGETDAKV